MNANSCLPEPPGSRPLIDADQAAFMQRGMSISVGSCDASGMPGLVRAVGCRISPDLRQVTVLVSKSQASVVLDDIRNNHAIAVVFSEPSTHRTIQVKATSALVGGLADGDRELVERHQKAFVKELAKIGFAEPFVQSLLACEPVDLICISFLPCAAFSQTPGPKAGEPLRAGA